MIGNYKWRIIIRLFFCTVVSSLSAADFTSEKSIWLNSDCAYKNRNYGLCSQTSFALLQDFRFFPTPYCMLGPRFEWQFNGWHCKQSDEWLYGSPYSGDYYTEYFTQNQITGGITVGLAKFFYTKFIPYAYSGFTYGRLGEHWYNGPNFSFSKTDYKNAFSLWTIPLQGGIVFVLKSRIGIQIESGIIFMQINNSNLKGSLKSKLYSLSFGLCAVGSRSAVSFTRRMFIPNYFD